MPSNPTDHDLLERLRQTHPAWRLLAADSAPLVLSFCDLAFVRANRRGIPAAELTAALDGYLTEFHGPLGERRYPKSGRQYLDDWAAAERGFLRKYYARSGEEAEFDLTPATERALEWIKSLAPQPFVGTESRLLTLFQLLRDLALAGETDPQARIRDLERRRAELDREIERVARGAVGPMDATQIKERYLQAEEEARRLLGDFRQIEENFRLLDTQTRERIALSAASKGVLLDEIFGQTDHIRQSDQGKSFEAFWEFLMSPERQEALSTWLAAIDRLPPVHELVGRERERSEAVRHFPFALLDAGERAHRTVAQLVDQLRRFLDDRTQLENRRILELARRIETHAVRLKASLPTETAFVAIDSLAPEFAAPMCRALYQPKRPVEIDPSAIATGAADLDLSALFAQVRVDEAQLLDRIRSMLRGRTQVTLAEVARHFPLSLGLAELVAYFHIAGRDPRAMVDESVIETILVPGAGEYVGRRVRAPRVIFTG